MCSATFRTFPRLVGAGANWVPVSLTPSYSGVASGERVVLSFGVFSFHHSFPFNRLYPKILLAGDGKKRDSLVFAGGQAS